MESFWNDRYTQKEWAYGKTPNHYIKEKLAFFSPGSILFPAEGEGRNAVYAASLGWNVSAFDFSIKGKDKAKLLAEQYNVTIDYQIARFTEEYYPPESFDIIALTSVHFDPALKTIMHQRLDTYLKTGGYIILEAYSKEHHTLNRLDPNLGGPPSADYMYSIDEIKHDFSNYEFIELQRKDIFMNEGLYHNGQSSVIQFIGKKRKLR